ncbi:MAG: hypothetical protein OXJ56_19970 [Rhodospirillaceae bacterium]|nr:hypothetical protein [Rhodospirillaceae bacterium]MDE0361963.1 hypothetical protein [Rhodospirillaceae bacterium]
MDWVFFFGRFHVLVLHLPIGIILAVIALEVASRRRMLQRPESAGSFLWAAAAVTSIVTVALGYMHYFEGGFAGTSATVHMIAGTSVAVLATLAWLLRMWLTSLYSRAQHGISAVLVILLVVAGHYGGNLTHGPDFLAEYAPGPIRALAGLEPRRPPVTELAAADPWLDVVRPMLRARCSSCHNSERRRGMLDLSNYETTLAGGDTGPAISPGNAEGSELYYRITLARDHEDYMPAEGKTPLTDIETEIIRWWIDAGAPAETTLANVDTANVGPLLRNQLGL